MNTTWHEAHVMPKNATDAERLAWHLDHQKACACREIPEILTKDVPTVKAKAKNAQELAIPSNFRLGKELHKNVEFVEKGSLRVIAKVATPGGSRRTVTLLSTPKELSWKCTCTSKPGKLCKHAVAVALALS